MAHYIIIMKDRPGVLSTRMEHLKAHLAHLEHVMDRIEIAGPLRDAHGGFLGAMMVITAESEEDAREFLSQDPYFAADIWETIEVAAFGAAAGRWIGGKTW